MLFLGIIISPEFTIVPSKQYHSTVMKKQPICTKTTTLVTQALQVRSVFEYPLSMFTICQSYHCFHLSLPVYYQRSHLVYTHLNSITMFLFFLTQPLCTLWTSGQHSFFFLVITFTDQKQFYDVRNNSSSNVA